MSKRTTFARRARRLWAKRRRAHRDGAGVERKIGSLAMMWMNFALFLAIQIGLLSIVALLPDRLEYSPSKDWAATASLAVWIAFSIIICAKVWRKEVVNRPVSNWVYAAIAPAFLITYSSFVLAEFLMSPSFLLLAILAFSFFGIPLVIMALMHRIENPYSVDLITIPSYAYLTGLLVLCLLLVCGGWRWGGGWNDKIDDFAGEERVYAEMALARYESCSDGSGGPEWFDRISRGELSWRIVDIQILNEGRYQARLQFYTWMRIPTYSITFQGANAVEPCPLSGRFGDPI